MKLGARAIQSLIFGAIGGFAGWLIADPILQLVHDIQFDPQIGKWTGAESNPAQDLLFSIIIGLCIVLGLVIADAVRSGSPKRLVRGAPIAIALGIGGGLLGNRLGDAAFELFLGGQPLQAIYYAIQQKDLTIIPRLITGRAFGWAIIGGFLGLASGMTRLSTQKIKHGALGGLAGGFLGGLLFEPMGQAFGTGAVSRMVGFSVVGGTIGLAIALVEDLFKQAWVMVMAGRNEGRQYILTKAVSTVGRDELSDVGVFGDRSVAPHHATISKEPSGYVLVDQSGGAGTFVNGVRISRQPLRDGDTIQIGESRLEFHEKATRNPVQMPAETAPEPAVVGPPMPSGICPFCGQPKDPATGACACSVPAGDVVRAPVMPASPGSARLVAVSGPCAGHEFALSGPIRIGREPGREICLDSDPTVSRRHAVIQPGAGGFVLQDEGSSNGTYVNGARVVTHALQPGDEIRIGSSVFRIAMGDEA